MFENFCKSSFLLSIALQQTYVGEKNCLLIDSYSHVVKIILINLSKASCIKIYDLTEALLIYLLAIKRHPIQDLSKPVRYHTSLVSLCSSQSACLFCRWSETRKRLRPQKFYSKDKEDILWGYWKITLECSSGSLMLYGTPLITSQPWLCAQQSLRKISHRTILRLVFLG